MLLILDLDDTIFPIQSLPWSVFDPAKKVIEDYALAERGPEETEQIIDGLKNFPFDIIAGRFEIPKSVIREFYHVLQNLDYQLPIESYRDYPFLKELPFPKSLVTTGVTQLQLAKVKALEIEGDFQEIFVDDPFDPDRQFKVGIFAKILEKSGLAPSQIWVIGDNPNSELKAGRKLGMKTIQRLKENEPKADKADFGIHSFAELKQLIKT